MGFLSSPKASSSSQTLVSIGTTTLGGVQVSLTLLEKAMDGTNIPFVKGVAGAALEVIKIARAIQTNREECDDLMKKSTSLLIVILGSFSGKTTDAIPDHLKKGVERLATSFQEVLTELRVIEKRVGKRSVSGLAKAVLYYVDNEEKLRSCSAKLEWAMAEFQVTSNVDSCLKDLERHQELKKAVHDSTHKLLESQATIQRGQAGIQDSLSELRDAMSDKIRINTSELLSTDMPPDPRIFGRHKYIEMAVILLLSNTGARVAILGPGGMGKTSVALKIMHDARVVVRFGENRYWVPCEQAKSFTLFIELLARSLHLPGSTSNDRLAEIIAFLKNSEHLHVFLLDNFETPWDIEGKQSDVADVLTRLASIPSVSFIVTMRGYQYPSSNTIDWSSPRLPSLSQLDLDAAQEAFLRISPDSAGDPELKTLLQKLDCMPLAITLMAKLAEAGETVSDLLEQWKSERTKLLDQPGGDRRNSIEVSIKLSLDSRVIKGVPDSIRLLSVLALLPAGAGLARLPDMCPSIPGWKAALRACVEPRSCTIVLISRGYSCYLRFSRTLYCIIHQNTPHSRSSDPHNSNSHQLKKPIFLTPNSTTLQRSSARRRPIWRLF
ncbi:hypothetical protein FRC02_004377 [Tulasnella sp. 418]|nr:hypothetical protein FRC02_004377 [Tulasnella sp. 418]